MADKNRKSEHAAVLALKPAPGPRPKGVRWEENLATVAVTGDLDRDALWAIDYTIGRAAAEAGRIVLDLREVTHLDYHGIEPLIHRRKELLARGGELLIAVGSRSYVANILKAKAGAELAIFRTPEEATAGAQVPAARVRMLRR